MAGLAELGYESPTVLDRWEAVRLPIPFAEEVARTWDGAFWYADKRDRPRPVSDTWIAAWRLTFDLPLAALNLSDLQEFGDREGLEDVTE